MIKIISKERIHSNSVKVEPTDESVNIYRSGILSDL